TIIEEILILGHFSTKLLSTCCKTSDLMQEGITSIREPVLEMKAIYFMSPTCVDAFIGDFKLKPKYKAAYYCAKYIRVCKEINISFLPQESQVSFFSFPFT
uniref:Uncharacterized protein n=1 Tax=Oncorhynchus tshawytscha TaxID=74940 RepID=A0A8C8D3T0_ONCTS